MAGFRSFLATPIPHAAWTGQDPYGKPTYAVPVTRMARLEYIVKRLVTATGQERISRARLFVDGAVPLDLRDQLVLPDGSSPALLAVLPHRNGRGTVVYLEVVV